MRAIAVCALCIPVIADAKVPVMDLCELVHSSDVVTTANVASCEVHDHRETCLLDGRSQLKGEEQAATVCADTDFSESPKLATIAGRQVLLFLSRREGCFFATGGYRGVVQIRGRVAYTGVIADLAEETDISELTNRIAACSRQ